MPFREVILLQINIRVKLYNPHAAAVIEEIDGNVIMIGFSVSMADAVPAN
jgi:hypothetical protein